MRKILILANNDIGLYNFRKELIQELAKQYEVYISLPFGSLVHELEKLGCYFINTPISRRGKNPLTDLKLFLHYRKIIRSIRPDLVLSYTIKPNIYGGLACRVTKVPLIANITGLGTAVERKGILQKLTLSLYKTSLKKVNCVFFQNKENQSFFLKKKIIKNQNRLIPGSGVNLRHYSLLEYPNDNIIHFLFIARIMKEKGIDQYLEAAKYIKERHPNTVFHILGFCEQDYLVELKELEKKGFIKYHGMQEDIRNFHKISHCTIHPTYYPEGMSNVLLESAASGRPIITTKRAGCREIVEAGQNGYLIEEQNSQDLISKIEDFLNLDNLSRKQMGLLGRKKMEVEFDRKIVVCAYLEEIKKVLR
ncbi:glycosyltransferase family 4 protein [Fictibacillus enclensis]|uniref:glycosyltransferase family 4 protein n=1 Tax=Fictibacillus enclensis TaxID=1017270 RepID=UPI0025A11DDD|nr:glycosyltransferase family 4 protein [Fictibacillus enclensis]MDM5201143.1 glycosyltransferase family 4 protein [Fictibacillus enclensis]